MKNIAAAFVFFTRLPLWRLKMFDLPPQYFKQVINYWPIVGWLTAGTMAGMLWLLAQVLPYSIAVAMALIARLIITGALHEDGLADFVDGLGGGNTRERILAIMKDSHIGTYGVISLVFYFLLFYLLLNNLELHLACLAILSADPLSKFVASLVTLCLPYARTEQTSKSKVVYSKMSISSFAVSLLFGILPMLLLLDSRLWISFVLPLIVLGALIYLIKKRIGGYTGDCCGAIFLLCELSFYVALTIILKSIS